MAFYLEMKMLSRKHKQKSSIAGISMNEGCQIPVLYKVAKANLYATIKVRVVLFKSNCINSCQIT